MCYEDNLDVKIKHTARSLKTLVHCEVDVLTHNSKLRQWAIAHSVGTLIRIQVAQRSVCSLVHRLMVQHMVTMAAHQFKKHSYDQLSELLTISFLLSETNHIDSKTHRFITANTKLHQWTLSWTSYIHLPLLQPTSLGLMCVLPSHLLLGHECGHLLEGFLTKIVYALLASPITATCPAYYDPLNFTVLVVLKVTWINHDIPHHVPQFLAHLIFQLSYKNINYQQTYW